MRDARMGRKEQGGKNFERYPNPMGQWGPPFLVQPFKGQIQIVLVCPHYHLVGDLIGPEHRPIMMCYCATCRAFRC